MAVINGYLDEVLVNLAAGLIIFILDVLLIVWLLPRILDRRHRKKWQGARRRFVTRLIERQQRIINQWAGRIKAFADGAPPVNPHVWSWMQKSLPRLWKDLLQELEALEQEAVKNLDLYGPSLTPDTHRDFISWHDALHAFRASVWLADLTAWKSIANPESAKQFPEETVKEMHDSFDRLDQATERLLESSDTPTRYARHDGAVSLLPSENLSSLHWEMISTTLRSAAYSQRLIDEGLLRP